MSPLEPWRPSASNPWNADAASHLYRRAGFGAPPDAIERAVEAGPDKAVSELIAPGPEAAALRELDAIYPYLLAQGDADVLRAWLVSRMIRARDQLREKTALFWHGHFATSIAKVRSAPWMLRQYQLFLTEGLGRFGVLALDVARDPAMLRWLDNETNRRGHPNENFAREFLELFTLGVGNYSERDVGEAARAFTG